MLLSGQAEVHAKRARFTGQQIAVTLQQAGQGTQAAAVTGKMGVSEGTNPPFGDGFFP
jgi:hypothetical protein